MFVHACECQFDSTYTHSIRTYSGHGDKTLRKSQNAGHFSLLS